MAIPKALALTPDELEEMMQTTWNMRIATAGPHGRITLSPLWFGWVDGMVYAWCRGQKVVDIRRNPVATVLVDRNERFPELQAVMFQGRCEVLEDLAAEEADLNLRAVREQMGRKYHGGHGDHPVPQLAATARGSSARWIRFIPDRELSWDNTKLPALRAERGS